MRKEELIEKAISAMKNSYSPYSDFSVGAALLAKNGQVYSGSNIENASYSETVCAERTAFFNALISGEREFTAIAITGGRGACVENFCPPCGACRQVMAEFCGRNFEIHLYNGTEIKTFTLGELLPESFSL